MYKLSFVNLLCVCVFAGHLFNILDSNNHSGECLAQVLSEKSGVKQETLTSQTFFSTDKLLAGKDTLVMVQLEVKKGWHVYANPANPDYLYPVKLVVKSKGKIECTKILYPKGSDFKDPQSNDSYKVYEDKAEILAQISVPAELAGKEDELTVTVEYQACDSVKCLPPAKSTNVYKIKVASPGEEVKPMNQEYFSKKAIH